MSLILSLLTGISSYIILAETIGVNILSIIVCVFLGLYVGIMYKKIFSENKERSS